MLVQVGLCQTWSETTLLVFPRGGSFFTAIKTPGLVQKVRGGRVSGKIFALLLSLKMIQDEEIVLTLFSVLKMSLDN